MRKKFLFFSTLCSILSVFLLLIYGTFFADDPKKIPVPLLNKNIKNFSVTTFDGGKLDVNTSIGQPIILNFFASWCIPCIKEMPLLENVWQTHKADVLVLGIAFNDTREASETFIKDLDISFPVAFDKSPGYIGLDYGVTGVPETFFINKKGQIIHKHLGILDKNTLDKYLKILL